MRNIRYFSLATLLLIGLTSTLVASPDHLDGFWQAQNYNVSIEVEETRDGIRVRRTDQNDWFYYRYNGRGEYLNRDGNTYEFVNNNKLVFNNARRGQRISFTRTSDWDFRNGNNRRRGNNRWDDYRYDDPYYDGYRNDRRGRIDFITAAKLLDGRWINDRVGARLAINRRGPNLIVFFNGRDRLYCPSNNGFFVDQRGNSIKLVGNGKLVFNHRRFTRPIVFLQSERFINGRGYQKGYGFDW